MEIFAANADSFSDTRNRFEEWYRSGTADTRISDFVPASTANGFSNETYRVSTHAGGQAETFILRLPPTRRSLFQNYDVARQFNFMDNLAISPGVPVPRCRALEMDLSILGRPFFLVDCVEGQVPGDLPAYLESGWVLDASDDQRRTLWTSSFEALAALSHVAWDGTRLAALDWPDRGRSRTAQHIEFWSATACWGAEDLPAFDYKLMHEIGAWLLAHAPNDDIAGVVWGDARFGNIIYQDFKAAALLDWELAVIDDPRIDVAYMLMLHRYFERQVRVADAFISRLGGFSSDAMALDLYNRSARYPVDDYRYYWLFNAYKYMCMVQCQAGMMLANRVITEDALPTQRIPTFEDDIIAVFGDEDHSALFD